MEPILPNARFHFKPEDIAFAFRANDMPVPEEQQKSSSIIVGELESELLDVIDSEIVYYAIRDTNEELELSAPFFFYVGIRRHMLEVGIQDLDTSDYVANMMANLVGRRPTYEKLIDAINKRTPKNMKTLGDLLLDTIGDSKIRDKNDFIVRTEVANYGLFLVTMFPERLPGKRLRYIASASRDGFGAAANSNLASKVHRDVLEGISISFPAVRKALVIMANEYLSTN